jgi:uncharacterized protein with beta-barrel porin domain
MKNPVQRRLRTFQWAAASGLFLTSNALQAQPADSYLPATAFWLNLQGLSSPQVADMDLGGDFHISLLTPGDTFVRSSSDSTTFNDRHAKSFDPAPAPGPATNWRNPSTANWFVSNNWSNGVPNSTSSAVVANGGTAVIQATPTPTPTPSCSPSPPPDAKTARGKNSTSATSNASAGPATAQVGTLTIGSVNGLGGTVIVGNGGQLDIFQSLTVEANGTLKSLSGPAAFVLNGGSVTNLGTITGQTNGLIFTDGGTLMNAGSIFANNGSAIIVDQGNATIFNSGKITDTGGAAIDTTSSSGNTDLTNIGTINGNVKLGTGSNTVTLFTGSTITGNLDLGSNTASQLILDGFGQQLLSEAVTGTITDLGSLTKQGSGTWIIDEDLSAPISTDVIAGTLTIAQNATLTSSAVTIGSGGTVTGIGTIAGNVTNSGVISPGNPFGTLTIRGNYTQTGSGIFRLQLAGFTPGTFGVLAVTGQATLGGTLQILPVGNVQFQPGDKAIFLTANSISGSFSTIQNLISPNTLIDAKVVVLSNAVEVEAVQESFTIAACNPNSLAVAKALDSAIGDPRSAAVISFLDSQPLGQLCPDFTLISPEQLTAIFSLDVSLANIQTANLQRRLEDIRAGSNGFSSSGFTINGSTPSFSEGLSGPTGAEGKTGPSVSAPIPENRWGFFATGLGEFTDVSTADGARGFNFRTGGVTLGVDYRIGNNFAIGLTGGYAHTGVDLADNGSIDVSGGSGGFYATAFSGGLYLDTSVTGGASDYETHRTALLGTANGSTDSGTVNVLVAGGYDWTNGALSIGPIASFQYTYVGLNGFTETGSLAPLRFGDQSVDSIRSALGIKASYDWKIGGVLIRPELRASWQHEYGDSTYSIVASFANGAGTNFTVNGPNIGRDSLLIGAGVAILLNDRISTYIYYDGELARTNYDSQSVSAGLRITF